MSLSEALLLPWLTGYNYHQQVLIKFLDYYASFDWDNYCITVNGPVLISSLPDITGNYPEISHFSYTFLYWKLHLLFPPETGNHETVLTEAFFRECVELYSVPTKAVIEANGHYFPVKHFNIVDPLKHTNNLGRSVTEGTPIDHKTPKRC